MSEVLECVVRINGTNDFRCIGDVRQTDDGKCDEPDQHDGAKNFAHRASAATLDQEQGQKNHDGDGNNPRLEGSGDLFETFDCREDGNGWGNDSVAIQECGSEHTERNENCPTLHVLTFTRHDKSSEGENAAFTVVVCAHYEEQVFERDDDDK